MINYYCSGSDIEIHLRILRNQSPSQSQSWPSFAKLRKQYKHRYMHLQILHNHLLFNLCNSNFLLLFHRYIIVSYRPRQGRKNVVAIVKIKQIRAKNLKCAMTMNTVKFMNFRPSVFLKMMLCKCFATHL